MSLLTLRFTEHKDRSPVYLVYQYKAQTNFNMFKEHVETTAFQKIPRKSCDYQETLEA